jgi:hypothetical protein
MQVTASTYATGATFTFLSTDEDIQGHSIRWKLSDAATFPAQNVASSPVSPVTLVCLSPNTTYTCEASTITCFGRHSTFPLQIHTTQPTPARYSSFLASTGVSTDANKAIISVTDQSGNGNNLYQNSAPNRPIMAVNGTNAVIRTSSTTQGLVDAIGKRILVPNSDYTKMLLFYHQSPADVVPATANYFSTYQSGQTSLIWRNGGALQSSTRSDLSAEVLTQFVPVSGKWYLLFLTFEAANRGAAFYLNNGPSLGVRSLAANTFSSPMTMEVQNAVLALNGSSMGVSVDALEIATWRVALTESQMSNEQARLASLYGIVL